MAKIEFLQTRLGFEAGRVIDRDRLPAGVVKTLFDFKVIKELPEDGNKLDSDEGDKPRKSSSKPKRSKKSSSSK